MPFYFISWFAVGIGSAYKTMKLLGYDDLTMAKTLLLSLTVPIFFLFGVTILVEPVAFGVVMLGICLTVWFWKTSSGWRYLVPIVSALLFSAASLTHGDFIIFQVLGWVPLLAVELKRNRNLLKPLIILVLFLVPAIFFFYWPYQSGPGFYSSTQIAIQNAGGNGGNPNGPVAINGQTAIGAVSHYGFSIYNTLRLFAEGMVLGWNPVVCVIIAGGLFYSIYKKQYMVSFLGLISITTFAGTAFIYSSAPVTLSTLIRYAYDALPAFFILAPLMLMRLNSRKAFALVAVGLTVTGLGGALVYQSYLQSNLGGNYPFLNGNQSFLGLDYRAPLAQMRDYFHGLPRQHFDVLAQTQSLAENETTNWNFTPGVSDINVTFYPYDTTAHLKHFYVYLEPGWQHFKENATISYFVNYVNYTTIFDTQSFFLGEVNV